MISHSESATPICELKLRGERMVLNDEASSWCSHSFTQVLPRLPVMAITGMLNRLR